MSMLRDILILCKTVWFQVIKNWAHFYWISTSKWQVMIKCSRWKLFYYSHIENRKSFWERFNWVLTLKMDFESREMPIFNGVTSDHFTRYQKILWTCLLGCKKLLNFICLPMKFHNRVYLNIHLVLHIYFSKIVHHRRLFGTTRFFGTLE